MNSHHAEAFIDALSGWARTKDDSLLVRALRSPFSKVAHDAAAAYAAASRAEPLLDAIERTRLPLPPDERDALIHFATKVRSITPDTDIAKLYNVHSPSRLAPLAPQDDTAVFKLVDPVVREDGAPVRVRTTHFSASALNSYAECARKWFYRYVCNAVDDPGSSAATYGTAFHAALEDFHGEFPQPSPDLEAAMRARIIGDINWAFERYRNDFDTAVEVELHKRRAQRTAQRYVDWLVAESKREPFTVIGRELATELDLEGYQFIGYIDRVDRADRTGNIAIIDYKTGSIATSAAEYRDKVRAFREFQLPFYYWAQREKGETVSRLALIPLKDALLDVRPISLEVVAFDKSEERKASGPAGTITEADLERARTRMIEICSSLTSAKVTKFDVTTDASACTYCAYASACADKPHDEREKFGR